MLRGGHLRALRTEDAQAHVVAPSLCSPAEQLGPITQLDAGSDSSEDEREPRNTVGDVPLRWYKDEEHIGWVDCLQLTVSAEAGAGPHIQSIRTQVVWETCDRPASSPAHLVCRAPLLHKQRPCRAARMQSPYAGGGWATGGSAACCAC